MNKQQFIDKWQKDLELFKRVVEDPLMYTPIARAKAAGKIMAISAMLSDFKSIEDEKDNPKN